MSPDEFEEYLRERRRTQPDRLNAKAIFVTWAGLTSEEASRGEALATVLAYCDARGWVLDEYVVCRETHPRPANALRPFHIHGLFILAARTKFNFANRRLTTALDLVSDGRRRRHPEIISVGRDYMDRVFCVRCVTNRDGT